MTVTLPAAYVIGESVRVDAQQWDERYSGAELPQNPEVLHTPEAIAAALPGLRLVRAERVRHTVERDGKTATAIDALVRAERPA